MGLVRGEGLQGTPTPNPVISTNTLGPREQWETSQAPPCVAESTTRQGQWVYTQATVMPGVREGFLEEVAANLESKESELGRGARSKCGHRGAQGIVTQSSQEAREN